MVTAVNSAISGIKAAEKLLEVSAHNVANANTDEFKSQVASVSEDEHGGVRVTVSENDQPGSEYDRGDGVRVESSNVNYANEMVNQIRARALYRANLVSLRSYEETYKSVIDIMA